jgi:Rieske Fe-S protein
MAREDDEMPAGRGLRRRHVLGGGVAIGLAAGLTLIPRAASAEARDQLATPGDLLVPEAGPGEMPAPMTTADLSVGDDPIAALPMDPVAGVIRNGSRFNKLIVLRVEPDVFGAETADHAVDGIIAYSSICTHEGCTVSGWHPEQNAISCFCHLSYFSIAEAGKPIKGPARRALPILPLTIGDDGLLVVASEFTSKPGFRR